ncbi:hypothetical protein AcW1_004519 [Taiwanofungus camphoratus]|nr:hypothetical protein AcW1_004519 [Antrodia cinnamomea]
MDMPPSRFGQPSCPNFPSQSPQPAPPARPSEPPIRHVQLEMAIDEKLDEKKSIIVLMRSCAGQQVDVSSPCRHPLTFSHLASSISSTPSRSLSPQPSSPQHAQPHSFASTSSPLTPCSWTIPTPSYTRPRGLRIANLIKPWIPIILYAITSLGFVFAISFWKVEVFTALDALSHWLRANAYLGYAVIFVLIFFTTFPPVPLYSTLIVLSGYTFGPWTGVVISYCASLTGALTVFVVSRTFFRGHISRWLSCTVTIKRVVRAIEKRPKLLFLIRLAPYPYNVMNCLLAASPSLTFRTYAVCTALSLLKLIIHTSVGSSIHSFAEYHLTRPGDKLHTEEGELGHYSTIAGVLLCVAIGIYLSYVTRRAVNDELEDEEGAPSSSSEERIAFLAAEEDNSPDVEEYMVETPFRLQIENPSAPGHLDSSVVVSAARLAGEEA